MANNAAKPEVLYDHTQRSPARYIILAGSLVIAATVALLLWVLVSHVIPQERLFRSWAGLIYILMCVATGAAFGSLQAAMVSHVFKWSCRVRIDSETVSWRAGLLGFWHRVPVKSLESCRSVKVTSGQLIRDCLRGPLDRKVYWVRGPDAVLLAARAGRYWLGTDQPDAVLNAIRQAVGPRAWTLEPGVLMCRGRPLEAGGFSDGPLAADSAEPANAADETQDP